MSSERTPLLSAWQQEDPMDPHAQFCMLVGVPSSDPAAAERYKHFEIPRKSLYGRATRLRRNQGFTYNVTASLTNTLLLSQVILGAALTALGASASSHILITVFGAMNTIIAGLVAYLKSRGQPMRARMYRDDLERVVDEIENSEIMWLGISRNVHGYDEIDRDDVSVRSEIARLTRLYDRAVKSNTLNNPDMYMAGAGFDQAATALRSRGAGATITAPVIPPAAVLPAPVASTPAAEVPPAQAAAPVAAPAAPLDPDESPASARPKPKETKSESKVAKDDSAKEEDSKKEEAKGSDNDKAKDETKDKASDKAKDKGEEGATSNGPVDETPTATKPTAEAAPAQDEIPDEGGPASVPKFKNKDDDEEDLLDHEHEN